MMYFDKSFASLCAIGSLDKCRGYYRYNPCPHKVAFDTQNVTVSAGAVDNKYARIIGVTEQDVAYPIPP